jgi:hypothetical protein
MDEPTLIDKKTWRVVGFAEGKKRRNKLCGNGKGCNGGGMEGVV